ncbi:MAG: UDP-N-acetylmuramate dehydrogenase [Planctomycetota bacterium]
MTALALDVETNVPIPTWFKVGGRASRLVRPSTVDELRAALELDREASILGDGANLIVADGGVGQLVIDLSALRETSIDGTSVRAQAGARLPSLVTRTSKRGLAGMHTLAGVPASVGGAIVMNAGGAHGQIADTVASVTAMDRNGEVVTFGRGDISFGYRRSGLNHLVVIGAEFRLSEGDAGDLTASVKSIMQAKKASQPLADRSAGCCFKNPTLERLIEGIGDAGARVSAGMLIDRAGCKALRRGTAEVSPIHANFITLDRTGGRADDVIGLMGEVERRVEDAFGVVLEREVVVWGDR